MKKRILSMILALVMLIGLLPIRANADEIYKNLRYRVYEDHVEITSYSGSDEDVVIPAEIEGLPVTVIGDYAFLNRSFTSITIPNTVTSIEDYAFYNCSSLTNIVIPDSVISIGHGTFSYCKNLISIDLPDAVTAIGDNTFLYCESLTTINLPNHLTSIGYSSFKGCKSLTNVDFPNSLISIGDSAFYNCDSLISITIPDSVTSVDDAFAGCSSLSRIIFMGDAPQFGLSTFSGVVAFVYYPADNTTWTEDILQEYGGSIIWSSDVPAPPHYFDTVVTNLPSCAAWGYSTYTCRDCGYSFERYNIYPWGHTYDNGVCTDCGWVDNGFKYQIYEDHVELTEYTGSDSELVIPAQIEGQPVTIIRDFVFSRCSILTSVVVPDGVTSIGYCTFSECSNLTSIDLPDSVVSIGGFAFVGCVSLTSIDIPDSVTSIGSSAFYYCDSLACVDLSDSLTSINNNVFAKCPNLTSIVIPDAVTSIGDYAFSECSNLTSIDLPDGVVSIGRDAFISCYNLTSIDLPNSVTFIGKNAFHSCENLTSIVIPAGVTSIEDGAFAFCINLASVDLPDGITSFGQDAFGGCFKLPSIVIPDGVTSIGINALRSCDSLTSIVIPDSVTDIGEYAIGFCQKLTSIHFAGNAPQFGNDAFYFVTATAYYPAGNPTWTEAVMQDYGGNITWVPYGNPFSDVPSGSWYEAPVVWALENGITAGTSANTFSPDDQCLRSHVMSFLWRAAGSPEPTSYNNSFSDVSSSDWFYTPVLWAVENGITSGISATEFGANNVCSRYQVVFFLWKAAGSPEPTSTYNPFSDVKSTDFFYNAVLWAVENEMTAGISPTEFGTYAPCTRAQVMTFLYNAYT